MQERTPVVDDEIARMLLGANAVNRVGKEEKKRSPWVALVRGALQVYAACTAVYALLYPFTDVPVGAELGPDAGAVDIECALLFRVVALPIYGGIMCEHAWRYLVHWLCIACEHTWRYLVHWLCIACEHVWHAAIACGTYACEHAWCAAQFISRQLASAWIHVLEPIFQNACVPAWCVCWTCLVGLGGWLHAAYGVAAPNVVWFLALCWDYACVAWTVTVAWMHACNAYAAGVYDRVSAVATLAIGHVMQHMSEWAIAAYPVTDA